MLIEKLQHYGTNLKLRSGCINSEVVVNNDTGPFELWCNTRQGLLCVSLHENYRILCYHAVVINITIYGY